MIIKSKGMQLRITYWDIIEQDALPSDPAYQHPLSHNCSAIKITNAMLPDVLRINSFLDYGTHEENGFEIILNNVNLSFEERVTAEKYFEILCTRDIDNINLENDYPELFL